MLISDILYEQDQEITQAQLDALETVLDRVFGQLGIDVEFTRHFLDRVNDERNRRQITIKELGLLFKKEFIKHGKPIARMGPDAEAVMKDMETDINLPFALRWDANNNELDLIAKTVMRKPDFKTSNKTFTVEGYKLQLERDADMMVLHITDTASGKRTEVRGKPGYETGGYDSTDKLHILLDKVGKSVDISQLMNGEPVGINPKHPKGADAKAATDKAYSESLEEAIGEIAPNTEIYVDMDGVLADFFGEWSKSQGVSNWKDIEDPAKAIGDIKSIEDFWLNLPVLPKAKELLGLIKQVKGKYKICTSPLADDPRSEPHKREWVKKNLSFFPPEEVIVTHNKPQFAKQKDGTPNILIDDYGVNIDAWEKAGGIGFKYKDYKFNRTAKAIKNKII